MTVSTSGAEVTLAAHPEARLPSHLARALGVTVPATLPAVVTLRVRADGQSSDVVREGVPLPATGDGILKLPEGVK